MSLIITTWIVLILATKIKMILEEHDRVANVNAQEERFENLSLVSWSKPFDCSPWGYYASYRIGAEWVDDKEQLIVTPKRRMRNIDFLSMFMTCFSSDLAIDSFSKIYEIDFDQPPLSAPSLRSVVSPLITLHYLGVVSRIKTLKRGYVHHCENLKKVKGHIAILKNERLNVSLKRYDRICCNYDELSVDIPENQILKKALLFTQRLIDKMGENHHAYLTIRQRLSRCLMLFEDVSDDVGLRDVKLIKGHKLYRDYAEAIRLAKMVLRHFDYSINKVGEDNGQVVPFVLDMSLLYEHYVYGLLYEAYCNRIKYQYCGLTGQPDFLYKDLSFKAILDTKYIPKYDVEPLDNDVIRQLSGYSRDLKLLKKLGYECDENSSVPIVPCIIIYPEESVGAVNPFLGKTLPSLCVNRVNNLIRFYKIAISVPLLEK